MTSPIAAAMLRHAAKAKISSQQAWLAAAVLAWLAAIFVLVTITGALVRTTQPVPIADHWEFSLDIQRYMAGSYGWADLLRQHNEHRLFFPRLFFFADILLFHGSTVFLIVSNVAIQAAHAALLIGLALAVVTGPAAKRAFVAAVIVTVMLSAANLDNFAWAFQVQFVMVFMTASLAFVLAARARDHAHHGLLVAGAILAGIVSTFSMANGVMFWPVLIAIGAMARLPGRSLLAMAAAGAAAMALYLHGYHNHPGHMSPLEGLAQPLQLVAYSAAYLSGPLGKVDMATGVVVGLVAMLLVAGLLWEILRRGRDAHWAEIALLGILLFVGITAAVTASGRLKFTLAQALEPRYSTPALVFWSALLALGMRSRILGSAWLGRLACSLAIVVAVAAVNRHPREIGRWAALSDQARLVGLALLWGADDDDTLHAIHPDAPTIHRGAATLRANRLSIFAPGQAEFRLMSKTLPPPASLPACDGTITLQAARPLGPPTARTHRLTGIVTGGPGTRGELLAIADDTGTIVGSAIRMGRPAELLPWRNGPFSAGWAGYIREGAGKPLAMIGFPSGIDATPCRFPEAILLPDFLTSEEVDPVGGGQPAVVQDPSWTTPGIHESAGRPAFPLRIFGSWSGNDARTGRMVMGPVELDTRRSIVIPVVTGPSTAGLRLSVKDAETGRPLVALPLAVPLLKWTYWRVRIADPMVKRVMIEAEDQGSGWGQWLAIADPMRSLD